MTQISNLSIKKATIEIKVVRVDNHKMTKATFNQLVSVNPYTEPNEKGVVFIIPEKVLGWINDSGDIYVLSTDNGKLGKFFISKGRFNKGKLSNEAHIEYIKNNFDQLFIAT